MKPFSIICKSCASKLKVTQASAVGQVLACPKCGTMVKVTPPAGWVPPPSQISETLTDLEDEFATPIPSSPGSESESLGNFEDIDDLLASPNPKAPEKSAQARPPKATHSPSTKRKPSESLDNIPAPVVGKRKSGKTVGTSKNAAPESKNAAANMPSTSISNDEGPVLPTDQWTSAETKKRQRAVLMIASALGMLLLIGFVGLSAFNNRKPIPPVTKLDVPAEELPETKVELDPDKSNTEDDPLNPGEELIVPLDPENPLLNDDDPLRPDPMVTAPPEVSPGIGEIPNLPPPVDVTEPTPELKPDDDTPIPVVSPFDAMDKEPTAQIDVEPSSLPETKAPQATSVNQIDRNLGDLSSLLRDSGTSLNELKDLASTLRDDVPVGLPKYVVEHPDEIRIDLDKLTFKIGGLKFDNAPLSQVLRSVTAMTGIPITLDARSIAATKKTPDPKVTKLVGTIDLETALNEILKPLGLDKQQHPTGLIIGPPQSRPLVKSVYDLSGIENLEPESLIRIIKTMVEPKIWVQQDTLAMLDVTETQLTANCQQAAHLQIADLIDRISATAKLAKDPNDDWALERVQSKWDSIKINLSKSPQSKHTLQKDVGSFLTRLQQNSGVSILVDWRHVMEAGWNPQVLIPGNIREDTVGDVIHEICRSMELTSVVIDQNTVMITTFPRASQLIDVEVYPVHKLVAAGFLEADIIRLVDETIGRQIHRREYEPASQCLILAGPQSVQRQFEASLNRAMGN